MAAPTTLQALTLGARATGRCAWLVAPGLLVAFLRAALTWPALLFALAMLRAGAAERLAGGITHPAGVIEGALAAVTAPRTLPVLLGLWAAGLMLGAALRVAWVAGALPTLGEELAHSSEPRPRFVEGVAYRFAPLLGTALLGLALELAAQVYALCVALAAVLVATRGGGGHPVLAAALGGIALTTAIAAPVLASLVADAALARTSLSGDRPAAALAEGGRRVLLRPGAFLLAAFALGVASLVVLGTAQTLETATLGVASGAPTLLALGPRLMATTFGAAVAALLDLWRLGTIAALACGDER